MLVNPTEKWARSIKNWTRALTKASTIKSRSLENWARLGKKYAVSQTRWLSRTRKRSMRSEKRCCLSRQRCKRGSTRNSKMEGLAPRIPKLTCRLSLINCKSIIKDYLIKGAKWTGKSNSSWKHKSRNWCSLSIAKSMNSICHRMSLKS